MENNYRRTNTTVSLINYHFVFCPRYRRKIFLIPKVEQRFKELVQLKCKELEIEVIAIECDKDHTHIFLNCLPTQSPSDIMQQIKGYTSKILREEFVELSKMPSLWTRSYFVSTAGDVCSETIKKYVENQKKRYSKREYIIRKVVNTMTNFIVQFLLKTEKYQEDILDKRFEIGRQIYNSLVNVVRDR